MIVNLGLHVGLSVIDLCIIDKPGGGGPGRAGEEEGGLANVANLSMYEGLTPLRLHTSIQRSPPEIERDSQGDVVWGQHWPPPAARVTFRTQR